MTVIKKYIMRGVANARTQFQLGDFVANVEFTNGDVINGIAASVVTDDPRVQMAIERDRRMFGRVVFLEWSQGTEQKSVSNQTEKKDLELEDVRTIEQVREYLITKRGVAKTVRGINQIKNKCEELGIVFPNYSFD